VRGAHEGNVSHKKYEQKDSDRTSH